ncbi:DUF418 domain-containing protein [Corynebacterium lehmanniae]|uniref:DUF418 domain-containing protein n=1 Tax=Corynebacterium lehmanniae TaxID=2913497 RepID=A0ABT4R6I2_9CORY|nr:DUF418 domain-containing protein [Corynebacterium lehmanniae]
MTATGTTTHTGERTAARQRFVAPDLARGFALVGIAMANMVTDWDPAEGADHAAGLGGYNGDGTVLEKLLVFFETLFVHVRGLPMFATLLGVGIGMIFVSLERRGYPLRARRMVLARRYGFLFLFGLVHKTLFFTNDIMTAYGIAALILCLFIGWSDKALYALAGAAFALNAVLRAPGVFAAFSSTAEPIDGSPARIVDLSDRIAAGLTNFWVYPAMGVIEMLAFFPLVVVGFVWGRRGIFGDVDGNSRMLRGWAILAAVVIAAVGIPWGCAEIGALEPRWATGLNATNELVGMLTGPGILAAISLACRPLQSRINASGSLPHLAQPLVALGKRSMSGYLAQTILFILTTQPAFWWVTRDATIAGKLGWALVVWLVTVAGAWALEWAGKPGPFEWLHRRLSYGKDGLPEHYPG